MTKISDLTALTGAGVDTATDLFPIVDMSAAGAARNKNITIAETRIGLGLSSADSPQFTALNLGHASDTTITRVSAGVVAIEGVNIVTTAGGVTFAADIVVPDEAYDATAWNGSLEVPTKNAVRDKIESLAGGVTTLDGLTDVNAPTPSNNDVLTWDSTPGEWVAAAPTGGTYTDEMAQDAVGTILTDTGLAVVTYTDGTPEINVNVPAAAGSDYRTGTDATKALTSDAAWDAAAYVALNDSGGNIAVDLASGINFTMTMDGDYVLSAPSNGKPGQSGCIVLTQDGTGTQTLAYNAAWKFAGGTDPVLSTAASSVDILFYQVLANGTDVYANLVKAVA